MTDSSLAPPGCDDGIGAGVPRDPWGGCNPLPSQRRWSDEEKARIVSESFEPGSSVTAVAHRYGISGTTLTKWRRRARESTFVGAPAGEAAPPYIPVVVDGAASEQTVVIEALGVVVRLPAESAVDRIVAVASGLGRASS